MIWAEYKKQVACFWTAEEIDFSKDANDWKKLSAAEQKFIKWVLAFFAASDAIVLDNIVSRFAQEVQVTEAQFCYNFQAMMEQIHSEVYSLLIDTYIADEKENSYVPPIWGRSEDDIRFNFLQEFPEVI